MQTSQPAEKVTWSCFKGIIMMCWWQFYLPLYMNIVFICVHMFHWPWRTAYLRVHWLWKISMFNYDLRDFNFQQRNRMHKNSCSDGKYVRVDGKFTGNNDFDCASNILSITGKSENI